MNKILKSRNFHLCFKEEDRIFFWDSYRVDNYWVNIKYVANKMQDEDYVVDHFTEGWPKDSKEKISFIFSNSIIPSTKDYYFFNEKKYEYCVNS